MFSRDNEEGTELDYDIHYLFSFHGLLPLPPFEWLPNPIRMGTSSVYVGGTRARRHTSGAKGASSKVRHRGRPVRYQWNSERIGFHSKCDRRNSDVIQESRTVGPSLPVESIRLA